MEEIGAAALDDPYEEVALRAEEERLADAGAYREAALEALELVDPASGEGGALDLLGRAAASLGGREAFAAYRKRLVTAGAEAVRSGACRCATRWRAGRTTRVAWPWSKSAGACWPACAASTARTWPRSWPTRRRPATRLAVLEDAEGEAARLSAERDRRLEELAEAEAAVRVRAGRCRRAFGAKVGERLADLAMPGAWLEVRGGPRRDGRAGASWPSAPTWASRRPPWPAPPRAGSWPGPCSPSGWWPWAARRPWSSTRWTPASGGAAALALGQALHEVAPERQVLVVTHLAQVAAQADAPVSVVKAVGRRSDA